MNILIHYQEKNGLVTPTPNFTSHFTLAMVRYKHLLQMPEPDKVTLHAPTLPCFESRWNPLLFLFALQKTKQRHIRVDKNRLDALDALDRLFGITRMLPDTREFHANSNSNTTHHHPLPYGIIYQSQHPFT